MFNLIMTNQEVGGGHLTLEASRIFEYTVATIADEFKINGLPDFTKLRNLPTLFMKEGTGDELAYVGRVHGVRQSGRDYLIEHAIERDVRPITNAEIFQRRDAYGMSQQFEFSRNHWAVKDANLFRLLLTHSYPTRQAPRVFTISPSESIQPDLLSVMMPFDASFDAVYAAIRAYAGTVGLNCRRADDIWEHDVIIQDVVALIDRSRIVICDCSRRNANVFYEAGIAHTLGRDVILITQNGDDIPFDLRHLRYIPYHNNAEGIRTLIEAIRDRVATLVAR
jgi:hypothetical protein